MERHSIEFETRLIGHRIEVPDRLARMIGEGAVVRVSIRPAAPDSSEESWQMILDFLQERSRQTSSESPYLWQRDDGYPHLK